MKWQLGFKHAKIEVRIGSPSGINLLGYWKCENHSWERVQGYIKGVLLRKVSCKLFKIVS